MTHLETSVAAVAEGGEAATDAELLARWGAAGDSRALELIVRRHGGMVLGVCRRVLVNDADADDAFQATFLVFVRKARGLARPEQAAGWLHAVALRVARKARATRALRREREGAAVDNLDAPGPASADPAAQDLRRTLDEELDRLPEKYRLPIVLCELEGRTIEEAAQLLGWPKGTVAGRLSRGRELLRERLSRRNVGLPLFLILPLPGLITAPPSEALVSAAVATATGAPATAAGPAALADAILLDGRRRLGLFAALLLAAALLALLGWHARPASAQPSPPAPAAPVTGGCHAATS
jgi:RNA polymerase sigma factor (sigma-70 family)